MPNPTGAKGPNDKDYGILLIWLEKCKWRVEICVKDKFH